MNQRPTSTRTRRCCYALLVTVLLLIMFRNPVTRIAAVEIGSRILGTQVEIESVWIGWLKVGVTGIRIHEPESDDLQFEIAQMVAGLTPWDGMRHGIWAHRVVLQKPSLHLRFDGDGNFVTKFPAGGEPQQTSQVIPFGELLVHQASVHVHQTGRESFAVEDAEFAVRFGDTIRLRGNVPNLFGGVAELRTDVDAGSLSGRSKLTVEGVSIDTQRLAEWPLFPQAVNRERISTTASLSIAVEHPPNELILDRHGVELLINLRDLHSQQMGRIADSISITARTHGGVMVVNASGDLLDGVVALDARGDLLASPITANVSSTAQRCNLEKIAARFLPAVNLQAMASLQANATLVCQTEAISFAGSVQTVSSDIQIDNISVADVTAEITATGAASLTTIGELTGSVDGKLRSDGVSLNEIAGHLGLPELNGRIAAAADFHISLADLDKTEAHTATASLRPSNVSIRELSLDDTVCDFLVENGVASMHVVDAAIHDSRLTQVALFSASAQAPLVSDGELTTSVDISLSPTAAVAHLIGIQSDRCGGSLAANGSATCELRDVVKPQAWQASARIQSQQLVLADESIGDFDANISLLEGQLSLPAFPIQWRESSCTIAATGTVANRVDIRGRVVANPIRLRNIAQLFNRFSSSRLPAAGLADVDGKFRVATGPLEFEASGTATLSEATYAGNVIGQANLTWQADSQSLKLRSSSNAFLGGQYVLEATARELDWTKTIVEGRFVDIPIVSLAALSGQQIPISGVIDGGIRVTSIANLESIAGRAWVKSRGMSVHQLPLEISVADISLESSAIVASCEGFVGDGRFSVTAKSNLQQLIEFVGSRDPKIQRIPLIAQAKLNEVSIATLARSFDVSKALRSPRGRLNATCIRDASMLDGSMLCSATASVSGLQLNQVRLSDRITSDVTVHGDRLLIQKVDGRFADGSLSGKAELQFAPNPTGDFEFVASRVNLRRAAAPFLSEAVSGTGTIRLRARIGQVINGRADLSILQGVLAGVSFPEAKFPIDWSFSRPSKVARWQCRAGAVSAGGGKIRISSEGNYGSNLTMTTSARIERVDSSKLLRGKSVGAGIVNGTMTLQAKRARSLKQLVGKFDLKLSETETLEMPVLDQLPKLVSLFPRPPGQGEDSGTVHGRIAGGLLHVDELAITQSNVQILMSGNATFEGRLNFDVTASTQSNGPGDQLLSLADSPLMLAAPAPIALVAKANDLLKDRVVHVHVGGIATRPTLRLQPGKQLSQDAVRFFLTNSIGGRATQIATQQAQPNRR